jgi:hypothetical protein
MLASSVKAAIRIPIIFHEKTDVGVSFWPGAEDQKAEELERLNIKKTIIIPDESIGSNIDVSEIPKNDCQPAGLCGRCQRNRPTHNIHNPRANMSMHVCEDCIDTAIAKLKSYSTGRKSPFKIQGE